MSLEKIVLIFALFGSAKVVLDMVAGVFASAVARTKQNAATEAPQAQDAKTTSAKKEPVMMTAQGQDQLARVLSLVESLNIANESLQDSNAQLLERVGQLETLLAGVKDQPVKRARAKTAVKTPSIEGAPELPTASSARHQDDRAHVNGHEILDSDRFEKVC